MKAILNVIWLLFGGIWLALGYVAAGIVCCLLIVTIPFGIASFRIASYALWPFGRTVVDNGRGTGVLATLGNVIWVIVAGIWIAIGHVLTNMKMIPISLTPLGKRIVSTSGSGLVPYSRSAPYGTYPGPSYR